MSFSNFKYLMSNKFDIKESVTYFQFQMKTCFSDQFYCTFIV